MPLPGPGRHPRLPHRGPARSARRGPGRCSTAGRRRPGVDGRNAFESGSVSDLILRAARCPVLVLPDASTYHDIESARSRSGFVLVGLSGADTDAALVRTAVLEARTRGSALHLLHSRPTSSGPAVPETMDHILPAWDLLRHAGLTHTPLPPVSISVTVSSQPADDAVLAHARGAGLVVLGSRPGLLAGLNADSVSHRLPPWGTRPCWCFPTALYRLPT